MPVDQNISQQLAALIAVVAIAIIGVAILLIPSTWKSLETACSTLDKSEKYNIFKKLSLWFGLFILLIFITDFVGAYLPSLMRPFGMLFISLLVIATIIYSIVSLIINKRKKDLPSPPFKPLPFLYGANLALIAFCIIFTSAALYGVAYPMLNIEIGPFNQNNLNWAKWFLVNGISFFILGIFNYAYIYVYQRMQTREQIDDTVKKKSIRRRFISVAIPIAIPLCLLAGMILTIPEGFGINDFLSMPLSSRWSVSFTGTQFKITNESDFDWKDITFSVNKQGLSSGYCLSYASLKQGETFTVDAEEFANNEGIRFDPQIVKPIRFSVDVKNSMGRTGTSYIVFDLPVSTYSITDTLQSTPLYVNASIKFTGTQFNITNESDFDWQNITLSINKEWLSLGYNANLNNLKQGETYTINAAEFINKEGVRFNPNTMKPARFTIEVKNSLGQSGIYSGILK